VFTPETHHGLRRAGCRYQPFAGLLVNGARVFFSVVNETRAIPDHDHADLFRQVEGVAVALMACGRVP